MRQKVSEVLNAAIWQNYQIDLLKHITYIAYIAQEKNVENRMLSREIYISHYIFDKIF